MPINVSIVEDSDKFRETLARVLNRAEGFRCLSHYPNAEDALKALPNDKPEVGLMDINLPGMNGVECVRQLKQLIPTIQVMMLTVYEDTENIFNALAGLRYRVDMPNQLPDVTLPPEVRHNVFLAFKESVNNVVKHAQATEVHIRLRLDEKQFVFEIEDNGRGPAGAEQKTGRNGLRNMRKRMEDVGGNFSMTPAAGQGTLVRLTAPIKTRGTNAH